MLRGHTEGSNNNNSEEEEEELVTVSVFPHAVAAAAPEEEEVDEEVNTSSSSDDSDDDERNDNANAPHEPLEHGSPAGQRHTTRRSIHTNQYYHNDDEDEDEDDVRQCRSPPQEVPLDALIHEVAELQATEDRLKSRTTTALSTIDRKSDGMSTDVSSIHNARWEEAKARLRRQAATTVMPAQRRSAEWDESESDGETIRYDAALSPLSYDEYISEEDLVGETSGALKRRTKVVVHEVLPWYTEWAHSLYNWIRYLSIANAHVPGVDLYEANNPRAYFQRKEYIL